MEIWKTLRVSHIPTPPAATTDKCLTRRYTNTPLGTKHRSGQAPIRTYDEFLYFFRDGHTVDDNMTTDVIRNTVQHAMLTTALMSGHLMRTKNASIPNEFLVDIQLTKSGLAIV